MKPETLPNARSLALQVSHKMGLNLSETRAVVEAVEGCPKRAALAYEAILRSYTCPLCRKPDE